jgi:hypothetical protein
LIAINQRLETRRSYFLAQVTGSIPLRKAAHILTIASNAINGASFAFATDASQPQKGRAFQASSPKNFHSRPSGRLFFVLDRPLSRTRN